MKWKGKYFSRFYSTKDFLIGNKFSFDDFSYGVFGWKKMIWIITKIIILPSNLHG